MAKMNVEIPDKLLDQTAKENIASLEKKLANAEKREKTKTNQIAKMQKRDKATQLILQEIRHVLEVVKDTEEYDDIFGGYW